MMMAIEMGSPTERRYATNTDAFTWTRGIKRAVCSETLKLVCASTHACRGTRRFTLRSPSDPANLWRMISHFSFRSHKVNSRNHKKNSDTFHLETLRRPRGSVALTSLMSVPPSRPVSLTRPVSAVSAWISLSVSFSFPCSAAGG